MSLSAERRRGQVIARIDVDLYLIAVTEAGTVLVPVRSR